MTIAGSTDYGVPTNALSTFGSGGTSTFNNTNKTLTIAGTKTQVNSHLANIAFTPATNYENDFYFTYGLAVSSGINSSKIQTVYIQNTYPGVANTTPTRYFVSNTPEQTLFSNLVPTITESVSGNPIYTVSINGPGNFGLTETSLQQGYYSFSGFKSNINTTLSQLKFWPYKNVSGTQELNIRFLYANSSVMLNQTVAFLGTDRTTSIPGVQTYSFTANATLTPTYEQANYLTANILLVGGGGLNGKYGGGAAGGQVLQENYYTGFSANIQYVIIVGAPGEGATQIVVEYPPQPGSNYTSSIHNYAAGGGKSIIRQNQTDILTAAGGQGGAINTNASTNFVSNMPGGNSQIASGTTTTVLYRGGYGYAGKSNPPNSGVGAGGGGAGYGGAGSNAPNNTTGGNAGNGVTSSISGTSINYGQGMGGWGAGTAGTGAGTRGYGYSSSTQSEIGYVAPTSNRGHGNSTGIVIIDFK
jgi:hypothetical protein